MFYPYKQEENAIDITTQDLVSAVAIRVYCVGFDFADVTSIKTCPPRIYIYIYGIRVIMGCHKNEYSIRVIRVIIGVKIL